MVTNPMGSQSGEKITLPQQIQVTPISRIITLVKLVFEAIYRVIYHGTSRKNHLK